jgi:microcystin degradation protein MlrC
MKKKLRLAFGRIAQESHALNPVLTTVEDFEAQHYMEGEELLRACGRDAPEAEGFLKNAELSGFVRGATKAAPEAELVPLVSAWAVPAGPATRECFDELTARLIKSLEAAGPVDGIYLCLHGALGVDGLRDPETHLLRAVREVIGYEIPLVTSYDLHANLTRERVAETPLVVAYKTNPHRDHVDTGARAARLLARAARGEVKPTIKWRSLPMLLGGGTTVDLMQPTRGLLGLTKKMEKDPRVLSATMLMCHPFNSDPALGWSAAVVTDGDERLADKLADELAKKAWSVKDALPPRFSSPSEAIAKARKRKWLRKVGVITISDASDVVTAGSTGENNLVLKAFLEEAQDLTVYAGIRDTDVVKELWDTPVDTQVSVEVGGKLNPELCQPLPLEAKLLRKVERHGYGRTVLLQKGKLTLVVTEGPALMVKPDFYTGVGLDLWKADIAMVKNYFPFLLFFAPYHRWTYFVQTKGLTDWESAYSLDFDGPMHPRDEVLDWREADARRRAPVEDEATNEEETARDEAPEANAA